jgi:hypothetical protein
MNQPVIPPILGTLSSDIILACDEDMTICEANALALRTIGTEVIGQPLIAVFRNTSEQKARRFIEHLSTFQVGEMCEAWELFLTPLSTESEGRERMSLSLRGGKLAGGWWLFVGACEPVQLTMIYHEVLAINSELTNLVRQMTKDRSRLANQLSQVRTQEPDWATGERTMGETTTDEEHHLAVMHTVNEVREELAHRVTNRLIEAIPLVGLTNRGGDDEKMVQHKHNMALTARRFHDIVQAGATVSWKLVSAEFGWADRKLGMMGITRDHHQMLIDIYFAEVLQVRFWSDEERAVLERIATEMHEAVQAGYAASA